MLQLRLRDVRPAPVVLGLAVLLLLPACSINVKKAGDGEDKRVDIDTPVGGIHVNKDADVRDIGLDVYPGARKKESTDHGDEKSANVNISGPGFGLKVVAQEFESDDAPDKLLSYYRGQLGKFGNVIECHGPWHGGSAEIHKDGNDGDKPVHCGSGTGDSIELKVGTENNQHIVAVKPEGKGSTFALVVVRMHGSSDTI